MNNTNYKNSLSSNLKVSGAELNDFNEGIDYVFTLKDKNVLEMEDAEDDLQEIENQLLKEYKRKDKIINIFDEGKKEILPQYGEQDKEGLIIRAENNEEEESQSNRNDIEMISEDQKEELSKIREKFKLMRENKSAISTTQVNKEIFLNSLLSLQNKPKAEIELKFEKKFTQDYMTHEEFKSKEFKKKKIIPSNKKRITSVETLDREEMNKLETQQISQPGSIKPSSQVYDEYDELNFYLEKQRNLINKEKPQKPEEKLKEIIESEKSNIIENKDLLPNNEENQVEYEFISETTEFLKKVPTKKDIEEDIKMITSTNIKSFGDLKSGSQSVVNIPLPTERFRYGASSVTSNASQNNEFLNRKRKDSDNLNDVETKSAVTDIEEGAQEESNEIYEEQLVRKGIATALQVLRKRGLVGKKQMWGRFKDKIHTTNDMFLKENKDKKTVKSSTMSRGKEFNVELEYRDNKGRLLTAKEMYRQQSYVFHGKGPGKKKVEKRILREQLEEKMKNKDPTESSKTLRYLKTMQRKANTPFVVLQGKSSTLGQI
jgi:U4/U6.U5 tri-snRNP-associated protein 1